MFSKILSFVRQVIAKLIPHKTIETVEHVETPLSTDMTNALDEWYQMYINQPAWKKPDTVKTMNLPAFISAEIARQIVLEMKWSITGKGKDADGNDLMNPRAEYLKAEFEKLVTVLQTKLEQGCAAGGMVIKPYPKAPHLYFDWIMDWGFYPIAFDDDGKLKDVIFPDTFTVGRTTYTRLERHTIKGDSITITQRAFKSNMPDALGTEIPLSEVEQWAELKPEVKVNDTSGQLFGWYKVAAANCVDVDSPMGVSVYAKARDTIEQADLQYSRLLWEFEGSELAIDVDPTVLRPKDGKDGKPGMDTPHLKERLFRKVDLGKDDTYNVFSPAIRDASLINGLNHLLTKIEDQCGLSRGSLSDPDSVARTATELRIIKERTYTTIASNQAALETCLRDVVRVMDRYATLYQLAPEGEYDVSFEWDDSIINDTSQQLQERLLLYNAGVYGKAEMRQWYFGETMAQAQVAIDAVQQEQLAAYGGLNGVLPQVLDGQ